MSFLLSTGMMLLIASGAASPGGQSLAKQPFTIVISTENLNVKVGSPVTIKLELTNTSQQSIDTSANISNQTGLDPNFNIDVHDPSGHPAAKKVPKHPELATGRAFLDRLLAPGATLTEHFDLSRAYDFSQPGQYVIEMSRAIPKGLGTGVVTSNTITVTVTP
jgi:hypothetical protein